MLRITCQFITVSLKRLGIISWRKFDVDGPVRYADQPGHRAHWLPIVLHLEPLHHLRHHDVQLQPGEALPNARSEMAENICTDSSQRPHRLLT